MIDVDLAHRSDQRGSAVRACHAYQETVDNVFRLLIKAIGVFELASVGTESRQESQPVGQLKGLPNFLTGLNAFGRSVFRFFKITDIAVELGQTEHCRRDNAMEFIGAGQRDCLLVKLNCPGAFSCLVSHVSKFCQYRSSQSAMVPEART